MKTRTVYACLKGQYGYIEWAVQLITQLVGGHGGGLNGITACFIFI